MACAGRAALWQNLGFAIGPGPVAGPKRGCGAAVGRTASVSSVFEEVAGQGRAVTGVSGVTFGVTPVLPACDTLTRPRTRRSRHVRNRNCRKPAQARLVGRDPDALAEVEGGRRGTR